MKVNKRFTTEDDLIPDTRMDPDALRFIAAIQEQVISAGRPILFADLKRRLIEAGEWRDKPPFLDLIGLCDRIEAVPGDWRLRYQAKSRYIELQMVWNGRLR